MAGIDRGALHRRWTHSHEEDEPGRMTFRPAGWDFPPSRGRRSFELRPDGSLIAAKPGPTDQIVTAQGKWRLLPGGVLELEQPSGTSRLRIIEVGPDKLVAEA